MGFLIKFLRASFSQRHFGGAGSHKSIIRIPSPILKQAAYSHSSHTYTSFLAKTGRDLVQNAMRALSKAQGKEKVQLGDLEKFPEILGLSWLCNNLRESEKSRADLVTK